MVYNLEWLTGTPTSSSFNFFCSFSFLLTPLSSLLFPTPFLPPLLSLPPQNHEKKLCYIINPWHSAFPQIWNQNSQLIIDWSFWNFNIVHIFCPYKLFMSHQLETNSVLMQKKALKMIAKCNQHMKMVKFHEWNLLSRL